MESMNEIIQVVLFFGLLIALTPLLGRYMARVFQGSNTFLHPLIGPVERLVYKLTGVAPDEEMSWKGYFLAVLIFNVVGLLSLWVLQMTQFWLPLNPQKLPNVPWNLALNTAVSFVTNTNWQAYAGETTMSYLTQMTGLTVHNFLSAATGIAILLAVARGLKRSSAKTLGSFWVDLTRSVLYVLLPLSTIVAVILVSQGVVQTFSPYSNASLVETYTTQVQKTDEKGNPVKGADGKPVMQDVTVSTQPIPVGPAAAQIAIKQLGTNGGGFYGQNSAHPFENPTPLTNFVELFSLIIVASGLIYAFGLMVGDIGHARVLFGVMLLLLTGSFAVAWWAESQPNPSMHNILPNMEGKEQRFGVMNSVLWAVATTGTSCGAVNCMHDSLTPLAGMAPLWNIMLGCIVFGGVGAGLYGILMHVLLTVFIAGLLVGRTPEYLGKKIQAWEAGWSVVGIMIPNLLILFGSAWAVLTATGLSSMNNAGPHGLSEVFYAYASCANNNGSAFAGLNANTLFYNLTLGATMFIGRLGVAFAVLAIAGNLAAKKTVPASGGTLPVGGFTFACTLLGVIIIVAALTFFPALCLGPIVEHGLMQVGRTF
jgi:K+-transporting ATPase ATPase A chain